MEKRTNIKEILADKFKTNDFIEKNKNFVISVIKKNYPTVLKTYEKEDYIQEGLLSFYKAMTKYEDSDSFSFFNYAAVVIRNDLYKKVLRRKNKLHQFNGEHAVCSNDKIHANHETKIIDAIPDEYIMEDKIVSNDSAKQIINNINDKLIPNLKPEYQEILAYRLDNKSYADIARIMGCTRENIRQKVENIKKKAIKYKIS